MQALEKLRKDLVFLSMLLELVEVLEVVLIELLVSISRERDVTS